MKLPTYAIQTGLRGIVCQRLLRRVCRQCLDHPSGKEGCKSCHGTGYKGRVPIFQLVDFNELESSQQVFTELENGATATSIDARIQDVGLASLEDQATELIDTKITDPAEVFRVLGSRV